MSGFNSKGGVKERDVRTQRGMGRPIRWIAVSAMGAWLLFVSSSDVSAKTVALIDNSFKDTFLNCGEGWVRATGVPDANIQIGGNFTNGLATLASGDVLIIVAHSTGAGNFVWGKTAYTGFGNGPNQMPLPNGFANLNQMTVNFVTCFSATAPAGGTSILSQLLTAMSGGDAVGSGFVGQANTHVAWNMSNGTPAQYTAAEACINAGGSPWVNNPPANRPNTGGNGQPANQRSAGQALMDNNCAGVPPNKLTFNIPNRVGISGQLTGYPPPTDSGMPNAASFAPAVDSLSVCGMGDDSHVPDDNPVPVQHGTWGKLKSSYR
jgi:hypothetical protein